MDSWALNTPDAPQSLPLLGATCVALGRALKATPLQHSDGRLTHVHPAPRGIAPCRTALPPPPPASNVPHAPWPGTTRRSCPPGARRPGSAVRTHTTFCPRHTGRRRPALRTGAVPSRRGRGEALPAAMAVTARLGEADERDNWGAVLAPRPPPSLALTTPPARRFTDRTSTRLGGPVSRGLCCRRSGVYNAGKSALYCRPRRSHPSHALRLANGTSGNTEGQFLLVCFCH